MDDNVKNRLLQFLKYLGIGQNQFEKNVGIASGSVAQSKGNFGINIIKKIALAYPQLNIEWLIFGNGEMLKSGSGDTIISGGGDVVSRNYGKVNIERNADDELQKTVSDLKKQVSELKKQIEELKVEKTELMATVANQRKMIDHLLQ